MASRRGLGSTPTLLATVVGLSLGLGCGSEGSAVDAPGGGDGQTIDGYSFEATLAAAALAIGPSFALSAGGLPSRVGSVSVIRNDREPLATAI